MTRSDWQILAGLAAGVWLAWAVGRGRSTDSDPRLAALPDDTP